MEGPHDQNDGNEMTPEAVETVVASKLLKNLTAMLAGGSAQTPVFAPQTWESMGVEYVTHANVSPRETRDAPNSTNLLGNVQLSTVAKRGRETNKQVLQNWFTAYERPAAKRMAQVNSLWSGVTEEERLALAQSQVQACVAALQVTLANYREGMSSTTKEGADKRIHAEQSGIRASVLARLEEDPDSTDPLLAAARTAGNNETVLKRLLSAFIGRRLTAEDSEKIEGYQRSIAVASEVLEVLRSGQATTKLDWRGDMGIFLKT